MFETFKHFVRKGKERGELERRLRLYTKPTTCGKISFEGDSNAEAYPVPAPAAILSRSLLSTVLSCPRLGASATFFVPLMNNILYVKLCFSSFSKTLKYVKHLA